MQHAILARAIISGGGVLDAELHPRGRSDDSPSPISFRCRKTRFILNSSIPHVAAGDQEGWRDEQLLVQPLRASQVLPPINLLLDVRGR